MPTYSLYELSEQLCHLEVDLKTMSVNIVYDYCPTPQITADELIAFLEGKQYPQMDI